jgi:hypothetical protein
LRDRRTKRGGEDESQPFVPEIGRNLGKTTLDEWAISVVVAVNQLDAAQAALPQGNSGQEPKIGAWKGMKEESQLSLSIRSKFARTTITTQRFLAYVSPGSRCPHAVGLNMYQHVCDFGKHFSNVQPHIGRDLVSFGDSDSRINLHMKVNVVL